MRPAAILFDLDGTLVSTGGAGKRSIEQAVVDVTGIVGGVNRQRLDGMTDRAIIRTAVDWGRADAGPSCTEDEIDRVLERYVALLAESLPTCDYRVMPGLPDELAWLRSRGWAVGLGTGNVERGARIKLERSGLNALLPFGGFGSDAEDRGALLRAGFARASSLLGRTLESHEMWVVGDTPKDISAARQAGAKVVAVATGGFSVDDLRAYQPDATIADLSAGVRQLFDP
jgi:phosphoglycolate phosphatase-like HAD superfamily hydrolase